MRSDLTKKAFLGLGPLMIPLPGFILRNEIRRSARAIRQGTDHLTPEERKVHRFVVRSVTASSQPVSLGDIVRGLSLPLSRVEEIVNQLEDLKVFFYRYNNPGINWAYPVTAEEREYKLTFSSGEGCTAAWAADAVANPFVQGRLQNQKLSMTIDTVCANSGKAIQIQLNSDLDPLYVDPGADPMICLPRVDLLNTDEPSIVDIFWRKSLFFWSEEDARAYQKETRENFTIYLSLFRSIELTKQVQDALFPLMGCASTPEHPGASAGTGSIV